MRFVFLLAPLFLGAYWAVTQAADAPSGEVTGKLVAGPSRLQSEFGPTLTGEALDAYREWSRAPEHFGAFAATDYGEYGWVSAYNTIEAAEIGALGYCGVPDCKVFARTFPLRRANDGELVVSLRTATAFAEFLTLPNSKAFAVHGNGAGGSWINAGSLPSAVTGALKECDRKSRMTDSDIPLSDGIEGCRIVHAEW